MTAIARDFRLAVRTLMKARGFTIVAVLTLAVALGANSAIFSVIDGVLLRPLPFGRPERIVAVTQTSVLDGSKGEELSYPNIYDLDHATKTLAVAGWFRSSTFLMEGDEPQRIRGLYATANMFDVLGVQPILGRAFTEADDRQGAPPALLLTYEAWQRFFGRDPHVVGRSIRVGTAGRSRVVLGIMPRGFQFPVGGERLDFVTPLVPSLDPSDMAGRSTIFIDAVGRLSGSASIEAARAEVDVLAKRLDQQFPQSNRGIRFVLTPLQEQVVAPLRPSILMLLAAVGVVLLIGCANVANLLLARATARQKEITIRTAVGATRGRLVRQLLVESVVLSLLAGVIGLLLAAWGVDALVALAPRGVPRLDAVTVDARVLGFSFVLAVFTGIAFGLAPALAASATDLTQALKEGTRGSTDGRRRGRMRDALVIAEIALSVVLLAGAGLLLRSFLRISSVDAGFDHRDAIVLDLSARAAVYKDEPRIIAFFDRVRAELASIPGVEAVGGSNHLPLGRAENVFTFTIPGRQPFPSGREPSVTTVSITPNYFRTMRIPLLRGRDFTAQDGQSSAPVLIVSQAFVKQFFPNEDVIGKVVDVSNGTKPATVIGVVGDVRFNDLTADPRGIFYFPVTQSTTAHMQFVVRARGAERMAGAVRAALRRVDPQQPVTEIRTLASMRGETLAARRFVLALTALLSAIALILAAVGIYSVMSYTVAQRTPEIGIRMAIGADARAIFRLVVGNALRLVAIGLACGLAVALTATRVAASFLYATRPTDPLTFAGICGLIAFTAVAASFVPASRAAAVDPFVAIRNE